MLGGSGAPSFTCLSYLWTRLVLGSSHILCWTWHVARDPGALDREENQLLGPCESSRCRESAASRSGQTKLYRASGSCSR